MKRTINELSSHSLAAILVVPMLGSGVCFVGEETFLLYLRKTSSELGSLLVSDEAMNSRLPYFDMALIEPVIRDIMALGKWVGGGMSFGAFGGRKDIIRL